jgi:hypothetical protein
MVRCDDDVASGLCGMRQDVREIVEHAFAELHNIVPPAAGLEILYHIVPEVWSEHKRVGMPSPNEQVVRGSARQEITAARSDDRIPRTFDNLSGLIKLLGREGVNRMRRGVGG